MSENTTIDQATDTEVLTEHVEETPTQTGDGVENVEQVEGDIPLDGGASDEATQEPVEHVDPLPTGSPDVKLGKSKGKGKKKDTGNDEEVRVPHPHIPGATNVYKRKKSEKNDTDEEAKETTMTTATATKDKKTKTSPKSPKAEANGKAPSSKGTKAAAKTAPAPKPAKATARPKAASGERGISLIEAAAKLLKGRKGALGCNEIVAELESKGIWKSPGGKTPASTLYASILREMANKGDESRFVKVEKGKFGYNPKLKGS